MMRYRVHQSSLGSWFVYRGKHVLHIYPGNMWRQAVNAAIDAATTDQMEATA